MPTTKKRKRCEKCGRRLVIDRLNEIRQPYGNYGDREYGGRYECKDGIGCNDVNFDIKEVMGHCGVVISCSKEIVEYNKTVLLKRHIREKNKINKELKEEMRKKVLDKVEKFKKTKKGK